MIQLQNAPFLLISCLALLTLGGLVTLVWGRKLPRNGDWLVGILLALLFGGLVFAGNGLLGEGVPAKEWLRGWIWPVDARGAVTAGILLDPLGLSMVGLTTLISAALLGNPSVIPDQLRKERFYSAVALGTAGVGLAWLSLTPWFALAGLSLVVFAGFLSLGSRWDSNAESVMAIRFGFYHSFGLILAVLGACGLAGARSALRWDFGASGDVIPWLVSGQGLSVPELAGASLLIAGLCVQLNPFPFLGWVVSPSKTAPPVRASMTQVFPLLGVFAILLRLQFHLGTSALFSAFGWALLGSTVLAAVSGMFQTEWELALGAWLSAGSTFVVAVLFLSGAFPALSLLVAFAAGSIAFASARAVLSGSGAGAGGPRAGWVKAAGFLGVCASTGVLGFASAGGGLRWVLFSWDDPALFAAAISVFALFAVLGWKLAWSMRGKTPRPAASPSGRYSGILCLFLLVILGLGIVWTGSISGGGIPGDADRVNLSLLGLFFKNARALSVEDPAFLSGAMGYWGALVLAILAGYWAENKIRAPSGEERGLRRRLFRFVVSGYGTDRAAEWALEGLTRLAGSLQWLVDGKVWGSWMPLGFSAAVKRTAETVSSADAAMSAETGKAARHWVDAPAKFLQLIQNGDVQWYLLFALGSGFAILVHFLWSGGANVIQ